MKTFTPKLILAILLLSGFNALSQVHDLPKQTLCLSKDFQPAPLTDPIGVKSIFTEDFSAGCPPPDWTIVGDGQDNWESASSNNALGTVPEGSFSWTPQFEGDSKLVSPIINTTGYDALLLEFKHMLNDFSGEYYLRVETTSDGGATWTQAWSKYISGDIDAEIMNIIISNNDVGSENFQFTLSFNGNSYNTNFWYFDDIMLTEALSFDAGVIALNPPSLAAAGDAVEIPAIIKNFGTETIAVDVILEVYEAASLVYTTTKNTGAMSSTQTDEVVFDEWIPTAGIYDIIVRTNLAGDENPDNDTLNGETQIIENVIAKKPCFEEFTSSTCIPCAGVNPIIDQVFFSNPGEYSLIKYQVNWPGAGDPYYIEDNGTRKDYYNVSYVPSLYANSEHIDPASSLNQSLFDNYTDMVTGLEIVADASIENEAIINIEATINSFADYDAGLTARIVVVEKATYGNTSSNLEEEFHNVVMAMLPDAEGTTLDALPTGGQIVLNESYDMTQTFMEQANDLAVIVFVQDDLDKSIVQSEMIDVSGTFVTYSVTFNVEDYLGNAIDDAIVKFGINGIHHTGTNGQTEFPEVFPGTYHYEISKSGLQTDTGTIEVVDENMVLDIVLEDPGYFFYEDFNAGIPNDWTEYSASGNTLNIYWYDGFVVFYRPDANDTLFQLMSPEINLNQAGTLIFEVFDPSNAPSIIVGTVPDPSEPESFTEIESFTLASGTNDYTVVLEDHVITDSYLAFRYEGPNPGYFYFDNVRITSSSTALSPPSNLSTEVNDHDVMLNWLAPELKELLGYNIYRESELIGFADETTYTDLDLEDGLYEYYVTAVYDEGESAASNTAQANVGNVLVYCASEGGGDQYISNITFGDIDNDSDFEGYGDFTNLSTDIYLDSTYTLSLTIPSPSSGDDNGVWIDFNQNGAFEEEENLVCEMDNGAGSFSWEITVPEDAVLGNTRMRVKNKYWEMGCDACGYTTYGETEDYTVNIMVDDMGIEDLEANHFQVFPNPARDVVNIKSLSKITSIYIYNYHGQQLYQKQLSDYQAQVNTSDYSPGIYLFLIQTEKGMVSEKVFIGF